MATQQTFVGQGPIYLGEYDAVNGQAASGYLVNVRKVGCGNRTLKTEFTRETGVIKESCTGQALTLRRFTKSKAANVTLGMVQFSRDELAMALYGQALSRAASTVTAETLPTVAVGDYVHSKHPGISSLVITDSAGTPATLVEDTHYTIDSADHGRIKILDLGSFTQPFKLAYAYAAYGQVTAFTAASTQRGLIFDGLNVSEGNAPVRVFVPLIDFDPTKGFDWLGDAESVLELSGEVLYCDALVNDSDYGPFMRVDALPG